MWHALQLPHRKSILTLHHGPEETSCFAQEGRAQEEGSQAQVAQAPQQQEGCRAQAQEEEELQEGLGGVCTPSWWPFVVLPGEVGTYVAGLMSSFLHVRLVSVFCEELPQEIQVGVA